MYNDAEVINDSLWYVNPKKIKQTLQTELKKIAEDVIGEEVKNKIRTEEEFLNESNAYLTGCKEGWNKKREKDITYFQTIGVEIK